MPWTEDELDRIARSEELDIASLNFDDELGGWRTIWVVRVANDLFVRSVRGTTSQWFSASRERRQGRVRAGGVDRAVDFVDADTETSSAVDAAYRAKYDHYAKYILDDITSTNARATTIKLITNESKKAKT